MNIDIPDVADDERHHVMWLAKKLDGWVLDHGDRNLTIGLPNYGEKYVPTLADFDLVNYTEVWDPRSEYVHWLAARMSGSCRFLNVPIVTEWVGSGPVTGPVANGTA